VVLGHPRDGGGLEPEPERDAAGVARVDVEHLGGQFDQVAAQRAGVHVRDPGQPPRHRVGQQRLLAVPAQVQRGLPDPGPAGHRLHGESGPARVGEQVERGPGDAAVHPGVARASRRHVRRAHRAPWHRLLNVYRLGYSHALPDHRRTTDQPVPAAQRRAGGRVGQVGLLPDRLPQPGRVRLRRPHLPGQPAGTQTHGQPTVTSCAQIGEPVDVAYLMVPQAGLLEALDDAAAAGIRNACVLSSGYAEAGEAGRAAQAERADHAAGLGMVLLGPNHLGFANLTDGMPVCSIPGLPAESGPVALLSQSGASSSAMVDFARMVNVGLSYLVTLGNEAMITAGHVLDYLVDDPGTRAVAIFMETVRDPETFRRAARRAAQAGKAIVVLKAGSSALSARTAAAHTGALVGDDRVIDAVFADLGVIRVDSIEDMLITAGAAAALGRLDRPGIGIVSISGGACDIVADRADDLGADLPELAPSTRDALAAIMPAYGTVQNPLDVTGAAVIDPTIF